MHNYRERLFVPASWWVTGMITMFTFGSIVWFGFPPWAALVTYGFLFAVTAAFLLNWGRARIEISGAELLVAGGAPLGPSAPRAPGKGSPGGRQSSVARLPLTEIGDVRALDESHARALRGPRADPSAYLLIRPYLHKAVYVEVTTPEATAPYWLLATRHPAELAAAIESSRPAQHAGHTAMG